MNFQVCNKIADKISRMMFISSIIFRKVHPIEDSWMITHECSSIKYEYCAQLLCQVHYTYWNFCPKKQTALIPLSPSCPLPPRPPRVLSPLLFFDLMALWSWRGVLSKFKLPSKLNLNILRANSKVLSSQVIFSLHPFLWMMWIWSQLNGMKIHERWNSF